MSEPLIVSPEVALLVVVSCNETVLVARENDRSKRTLYDVVADEDIADLPADNMYLKHDGRVWQERELTEEQDEFDALAFAGEEA